MKNLTILIAALVLTFAETYSADYTLNTDLNDFSPFVSLSEIESDFSNTSVSNVVNEVISENSVDNDKVLIEEASEEADEEKTDELFDSSAGAMGLGIF
jgi:hypothetical protein